MNIAFFLTPKSQVVWLDTSETVERALARMRPHGYSAVPLLDAGGGYVGTLTEGDILWHLLAAGEVSAAMCRQASVLDVRRRRTNLAVHIDAEIEALVARAVDQNFVPVVDDRGAFIGIVRRKAIIEHCSRAGGPGF